MPAKKDYLSSQRGSTIVMALMILLVLSVLGMSIIGVAGMEFKTSLYDYETQQTQQAADAGVDWSMENIYQELNRQEYSGMEILPDPLPWGNEETSFTVGSEICNVSVGDVIKKGQTSQQGTNTCTYEFTSTGTFRGSSEAITIQVVYTFIGGYSYIDSGEARFVPRSDFDSGKIKSYKTL